MGYRDLVYRLYERRLESSLTGKTMPRHVGVMTDGNRRWARSAGHTDVSKGHKKGADKIFELLAWCKQAGVEVVTLWLLSTDNLSRPQEELGPLLTIIEDTVNGLVDEGWHLNAVGALDLLPDHTARVLKDAGEATANAVEHATAGRPADAPPVQVTLTASADHATMRLTVADTGIWRPPPADREEPAPGTRGHGIIFMHALMDDVTIDPSAHGTTVTLTKDLTP